MEYKNISILTDFIGIMATVLIAIKVIFLEPRCFSLFDGYVTILPVVFTKIFDIIDSYNKDNSL